MSATTYARTRAMIALTLITGSGVETECDPVDGDIGIDGIEPGYKTPVVLETRDAYAESVQGKDAYPTISLTLRHCGKLTAAGSRTVWDTIHKTGKVLADGDVTTDQGGTVWHVGARVTIVHPLDGTDTISVPNARWTCGYKGGDKNTIEIKGTCYPGILSGAVVAPLVIT